MDVLFSSCSGESDRGRREKFVGTKSLTPSIGDSSTDGELSVGSLMLWEVEQTEMKAEFDERVNFESLFGEFPGVSGVELEATLWV